MRGSVYVGAGVCVGFVTCVGVVCRSWCCFMSQCVACKGMSGVCKNVWVCVWVGGCMCGFCNVCGCCMLIMVLFNVSLSCCNSL